MLNTRYYKSFAIAAAVILIMGLAWWYAVVDPNEGEQVVAMPDRTPEQNGTSAPVSSPSSSPQPTPLPAAANIVDEMIQHTIRSIRIFEKRVQDYAAHETPFFSAPDPIVIIFPDTLVPLTPADISQLPNRIKIISRDTRSEVAFSTNPIKPGDPTSVPLSLILANAPKEDLLIQLSSVDGKQEKVITLRYSQPVGYTITSANDPLLENYMSLLGEGLYIDHYVELGRQYSYQFQFTHDMQRDSVQEALLASLKSSPTHKLEWSWDNDRVMNLQLDFREAASSPFIQLYLNGIRSKEGYKLSSEQVIRIKPSRPQALYQIQLSDLSKTSLFSSMAHYEEIDISADGRYGLAAVISSNEMRPIYGYTLLDLKGNVLKSFGLDGIHQAKWSPDGAFLIFTQNNTVMKYDLSTGAQTLLWSSPVQQPNSRVVSLDMDPRTGQLVVGWGTHDDEGKFTYDLHVSENGSSKFLRIPNVGSFSCYEGPCYNPGLRSIENGEMYLEAYQLTDNPPQQHAYSLNLTTGVKEEVDVRPTAGSTLPMTDIGNGKFLIHKQRPDQNWQILDKQSGTTAIFDQIPKEVNTVTKSGDALYYFDVLR
ncbi:MAG: hypothetical protein K0R67_2971 [Paenibacillus sp.]|nr:hypothetical protein [Paenibacillus sp.]